MSNFRKILFLFLVLIALIVIDVIGYMVIEKAGFTDSLYMTFISITTVGYREIFPLSAAGKIFTIWVIVSGLGTFFYSAGKIVESVLEGNIRLILGRRKMKTLLKLKDHVIVAGFGVMGEHVCKELDELKINFVVIESDNDRFAGAEEKGYNVLLGSAAEEDMLKSAVVDKAKTFISLLASDADNIFTVMTAREMNPAIYIVTRAVEAANKNKLHKIGADRVITPYELSTRRIVNTILRPNVVDFIDIMTYSPQMALSIEEFTIRENSPFADKYIRESGLRQDYNTIVIAVKRGDEMFFNPSPNLKILAGDILILVGEKDKLLDIH